MEHEKIKIEFEKLTKEIFYSLYPNDENDICDFKYSYDLIRINISNDKFNTSDVVFITRHSIYNRQKSPIIFPKTLNKIQELAYEIMESCDE